CGGGGGGGGMSASTASGVTSNTPAQTSSGSVVVPGSSATSATPPIVAGPPPGQWWKGDLHSHSAPHSQDADHQGGDRPGVCFFAEQAGLDYLALTDHRTFTQTQDPTYHAATLSIMDGEEWGGTVHIGMVGLSAQVPEIDFSRGPSTLNAQVQGAYDEVHRQG